MQCMLVMAGFHKACNREEKYTLIAVVRVRVKILQCLGSCKQAAGFLHSLLSISNCMSC